MLKNKNDGSYWICGEGIGTKQKTVSGEATYHEKAGKQYRGYAANVTESVGEDKSIITDYQFDANTHSDSDFLKEHLLNICVKTIVEPLFK